MASTIVKNEEIVRPKGNFPPSAWGDHFLNFTFDHALAEKYYKEIEGLKDEVKGILTTPKLEMVETMDLIDKLERLGISYHFQDEIEEKLNFFFSLDTNYEDAAYDLYTVEKGRGQIATGIDSYMAEHGMEKKETMQKIAEMASDAWKDINKNLLRPYPCSKEVLLMILNISRVIDVIYKNDEDGYTHPEKVIKPHIIAMYIEPFKI